MGSRRKRAGIGPTESASRPRRGGAVEREDEWSVREGCEKEAAPPRVRRDSLARWHCRAEAAGGETAPSSSERPTSTRVPETLPPPPPPARAAPPRTSPRAPPPRPPVPPGSFRAESVGESQASTRKLQFAAPPATRPASPSPSWVPSCSAQLGQGKVIPGREAVFGARLLFIALWSPSLASHPRVALSDCSGTGFLQSPSPVLPPPRGTIAGDQMWEIRFLDVRLTSRQLP